MKRKSRKLEAPLLVIDIGGTNFRSSLYYRGKLLGERLKKPTPNFINNPNAPIEKLQELLIDQIIENIKEYQKVVPALKVVGISFPAPITSTGIVTQACTVWGDRGKNFPLLMKLKKKLPVFNFIIANDITAAAEYYYTIKKFNEVDYFAVITVSSGIGGKIYDVRGGRVILDKRSVGGEMGHVRIDFSPEALVCDCGGRGHLGAVSSGRGMERLAIISAKKYPKKYRRSFLSKLCPDPDLITNSQLVEAIKNHDKFSLEVLDKATFPLACSISHISGNIGADKYIIIGGFALNCGQIYIRSLRKNLRKVDFYGRKQKEIGNLVELGIKNDDASLIGIGLLAQKAYAKENL